MSEHDIAIFEALFDLEDGSSRLFNLTIKRPTGLERIIITTADPTVYMLK
jgi:hypothetical protein